ncbi:TetR/AcrR family transcriptional regulator [Convivina intestini]|uniref:TetR/AcrR family transcriptional regulator n=1 Tax=Convivina intestini TaxID=1505726 RepID=UPI00200FDAF7|nr:TetR/AcrR family transcriptional regulator [Convivina intestini]CAH1856815.1 hypothetical protein R078131_01475 [Convivina intestini]
MTDKPIKRQQQVNQTVELLLAGLSQEMTQRSYQNITISSVSQAAGVSRRTFYRHFHSVDELLQLKVDHFVVRLYQSIQKQQPQNFELLIVAVFNFCQHQANFLKMLADNQKLYLVQQVLLTHTDQSLLPMDDVDSNDLIYYFGSGGISNIIIYWTQRDFQQTAAEVQLMAHRLNQHLQVITQQ